MYTIIVKSVCVLRQVNQCRWHYYFIQSNRGSSLTVQLGSPQLAHTKRSGSSFSATFDQVSLPDCLYFLRVKRAVTVK